jgi:hypothetical protein
MSSSGSPTDHEAWRKLFPPRAHHALGWFKGSLPGSSLSKSAGRVQKPRRLKSGEFTWARSQKIIEFEENNLKEAAYEKRLEATTLACDSATSMPAGDSADNNQPGPAQEDHQSAEHAQQAIPLAQNAVAQAQQAVSQAQHAVSQAQHTVSQAQHALSEAQHALLQAQSAEKRSVHASGRIASHDDTSFGQESSRTHEQEPWRLRFKILHR